MWPWEHLAVGYVCYSLGVRLAGREPPSALAVVAVAVGTQLPDLVDKPLSWGLGLFPSGYAVGHSALIAAPVGGLVVAFARRRGAAVTGVALVLGYWSHLAGDVLNPVRYGDGLALGRVLWPVVELPAYGTELGLRRGVVYLARFPRELARLDPTGPDVLYVLLPAVAVGVWLADGAPGLGATVRVVRRLAPGDRP